MKLALPNTSATVDPALPGHRRRPPQGEDAKRLRGSQLIAQAISTSAAAPTTHTQTGMPPGGISAPADAASGPGSVGAS